MGPNSVCALTVAAVPFVLTHSKRARTACSAPDLPLIIEILALVLAGFDQCWKIERKKKHGYICCSVCQPAETDPVKTPKEDVTTILGQGFSFCIDHSEGTAVRKKKAPLLKLCRCIDASLRTLVSQKGEARRHIQIGKTPMGCRLSHSLSIKEFLILHLHLVVHTKSDRSCVKNEKRELESKV